MQDIVYKIQKSFFAYMVGNENCVCMEYSFEEMLFGGVVLCILQNKGREKDIRVSVISDAFADGIRLKSGNIREALTYKL